MLPCLALLSLACSGPGLGTVGPLAGERVPRKVSLLLLPVEDATVDGEPAESSGAVTTADLRQLFSGFGYEVLVDEQPDPLLGLARARELGCALMAHAVLTDWNESVRDWRTAPDRVALRVTLYRVKDGALIAWGHQEMAGDSSLDLQEPAHRLVQRLARRMLRDLLMGQELSFEADDFPEDRLADVEG
jgi:hypothetical protein